MLINQLKGKTVIAILFARESPVSLIPLYQCDRKRTRSGHHFAKNYAQKRKPYIVLFSLSPLPPVLVILNRFDNLAPFCFTNLWLNKSKPKDSRQESQVMWKLALCMITHTWQYIRGFCKAISGEKVSGSASQRHNPLDIYHTQWSIEGGGVGLKAFGSLPAQGMEYKHTPHDQ